MSDTPMPVTGFALDVSMSEDGQTIVALLTLQTGELTFEFAINEDGARGCLRSLEQYYPPGVRTTSGLRRFRRSGSDGKGECRE